MFCCYLILHRRTSLMNCVKWRTSRLVCDSVLPRLHHWSSAALDYQPSGTEPLQLPLLVSGTVYHSTSLLHLRCLSYGHALRLISYHHFLSHSVTMSIARSGTLIISDTLIVPVTYLFTSTWGVCHPSLPWFGFTLLLVYLCLRGQIMFCLG